MDFNTRKQLIENGYTNDEIKKIGFRLLCGWTLDRALQENYTNTVILPIKNEINTIYELVNSNIWRECGKVDINGYYNNMFDSDDNFIYCRIFNRIYRVEK